MVVSKKVKKILGGFVASYLEANIDNDEFWAAQVRNIMNPMLEKIHPNELYVAFEQKKELVKMFNASHKKKIDEFLAGNETQIERIKQKMMLKQSMFDWTWIDEWWKEDLPKLRGVIINHPKSDEFKAWIVEEIKKLSKMINEVI